MRVRTLCLVGVLVACTDVGVAKKKKTPPPLPLTETGMQLQAQYAGQMAALETEIKQTLPQFDQQAQAAYLASRETEKAAEEKLKTVQAGLDELRRARTMVRISKEEAIPNVEKAIAAMEAKLSKAGTDAQRAALQAELTKWRGNMEKATAALATRQAKLADLEPREPGLIKQFKAAESEYARAKAKALDILEGHGLDKFLARDTLDSKLAKYVVLSQSTPHGLAAFAQQGDRHATLVATLLNDTPLMIRMAFADGAKAGKYGQAMKIYADIRKASRKASTGVLERLALAISLEHAAPIAQRNPAALTDARATVDPVKRYLHFEKAYLDGELDSGFKRLSVWDLRKVVDGTEPNDILSWGRKMLRNYRPDHILTDDDQWRYVAAVKTEIRFGSQDNKYDRPDLQFFQNILMNGGVCGRRAFFGRFLLRAFGVPTIARPQRGHAALAHWTPDGWVICLGAKWGMGRAGRDLDFLAISQARRDAKAFMKVKRAQWIGEVMGEESITGFRAGDPGFWHLASLHLQQDIIDRAEAVAPAPVGEDIGEANGPEKGDKVQVATIQDADRTIAVGKDGVITIPAAACSSPTNNTEKIKFMPSNLGGVQLHYSRLGSIPEEFEYTFDAPKAGRYALTARVVTPSWKQHLLVSANGVAPVDIALPFTVGMWETTKPVEVALTRGRNVLTFSHSHEGYAKGVTVRDFTLRPVRD